MILALLLLTAAVAPADAATRYVNAATCTPPGSGTSEDPYCTIQTGICNAVSGDTVSVAAGTYTESLRMRPGVSVISSGGPQVTTINGLGQPCTSKTTAGAEVAFCTQQSGSQCSVVVFASGHTNTTLLDGFTITGGEGFIGTDLVSGGGIFVFSSPVISNNIIENNVLSQDQDSAEGGGIYISLGQPVITANVIRGNVAVPQDGRNNAPNAAYGGGIYSGFFASPTITGNLIENNVAGDPALSFAFAGGGGIAVFPGNSGQPGEVVDGNFIIGNTADTFGGAISLSGLNGSVAPAAVTNNVIVGNTSFLRGGGVYTYFNYANIINNTILDNSSRMGGGVFSGQSDTSLPMTITNNIIDGNLLPGLGTNGGGIYSYGGVGFTPTIENNNLHNNEKNQVFGDITDASTIGFDGNISADSLFLNRLAGDYHLDTGSPSIDAALASVAPPDDLEGNPRGIDGDGTPDSPVLGDVDMGAYEVGNACVPATEICDGLDNNCDDQIDEGFLDTDLDGEADCVDLDDDNDGVADVADNCPLVANSLQLDLDQDSLGNACDLDADGDGYVNGGDCSPLDAIFNDPPGTASQMRFADADPDLLQWAPGDGGRVYSLYSWDYQADQPFQRSEACQGMAQPQRQAAVPGDPPAGTIRGFLLTPVRACGEGSAGQYADGTPRTVVGGCEDPVLDTDADGYEDLTDNCPLDANSIQADSDADGAGDLCDACAGPGSVDEDGDSLCELTDNCPDVANLDQLDLDGDGAGDLCDGDDDNDGVSDLLDPHPTDPALCGDLDQDTCGDCSIGADGFGPLSDSQPTNDGPDLDGDGLCDAGDPDDDGDGFDDLSDNCPLLSNDQTDTDGDGQGDACDEDDDNDTILDGADNCPLTANGMQLDRDLDGAGNPCDGDADGDGIDNALDCAPLDPVLNDVPAEVASSVEIPDGSGATLTWEAAAGARQYAVYTWDYGTQDGFQRDDACLGPAAPATTADVSAIPAPGTFRGYLVTGIHACGEGSGGLDHNLEERVLLGGCEVPSQDTDLDGYADLTDNCPLDPNPDQTDTDLDGIGDACTP